MSAQVEYNYYTILDYIPSLRPLSPRPLLETAGAAGEKVGEQGVVEEGTEGEGTEEGPGESEREREEELLV